MELAVASICMGGRVVEEGRRSLRGRRASAALLARRGAMQSLVVAEQMRLTVCRAAAAPGPSMKELTARPPLCWCVFFFSVQHASNSTCGLSLLVVPVILFDFSS